MLIAARGKSGEGRPERPRGDDKFSRQRCVPLFRARHCSIPSDLPIGELPSPLRHGTGVLSRRYFVLMRECARFRLASRLRAGGFHLGDVSAHVARRRLQPWFYDRRDGGKPGTNGRVPPASRDN